MPHRYDLSGPDNGTIALAFESNYPKAVITSLDSIHSLMDSMEITASGNTKLVEIIQGDTIYNELHVFGDSIGRRSLKNPLRLMALDSATSHHLRTKPGSN